MLTVLDVAPDAFASAAADLYEQSFVPCTNAFWTLSAALDGCVSMAGADPGGAAWATSYDAAVRSTVRGWKTLASAVYRAVCLLDQCGRNHEAAESASRAGGSLDVSVGRFDPSFSTRLGPLPSGGGGTSDAPAGWWLIEHTVGYVWPGGHQDRLLAAGAGWDAAALRLDDAADGALIPCVDLSGQRSPELQDALHTMWGLSEHLHQLAHACRALARTCRGLAAHIDEMRSKVEHELVSLGLQTVVVEGVGAVVSVFTVGGAEAPTQVVEASRIRAIAAAVRAIIKAFIDLVEDLVDSIPSISEIGERITAATERLASARIRVVEVDGVPGLRVLNIGRDERLTSTAMTTEARGEAGLEQAAERDSLPEMSATREQIESKFKHARALGVSEARGKAGFESFERRITDFVNEPTTIRIVGKYRGENAILNYNEEGQVVVQRMDGSHWSNWRLTQTQLRRVMENGDLGLH